MPERPRISIIIPVLNEADCLDKSLTRLFNHPGLRDRCEVVVGDGGSDDGSREIAARHPCKIVRSGAGRAMQMNAAAREARAGKLLFLHVDSSLPDDFDESMITAADWGFFRLRLSGNAFIYRVIESAINLRTRVSKIAGGDQGLFFSRSFFDSLGGFPGIPLMEDIAISKKARRIEAPLVLDSAITSSSRRWQEGGVVKTVLLMWWLRLAFWLGVDPRRLHRIYYPQRG